MEIDPGLAAIGAAGLSSAGGLLANQSNKDAAQAAIDYNYRLLFTEPSIRRNALKRAGYNPLLAIGAKVGSAAHPAPTYSNQNPFAGAADAANTAYQANSNKQLTDAKTAMTDALAYFQQALKPGADSINRGLQQLDNLVQAVQNEIGTNTAGWQERLKDAQEIVIKGLQKLEKIGGQLSEDYQKFKNEVAEPFFRDPLGYVIKGNQPNSRYVPIPPMINTR